MAQKIYESNFPPVSLARSSIWTFLFANDRLPTKSDYPAFIDPDANITLTRGDLRRRTLKLAWGARNRLSQLGGPKLKRGSTIMIFSPNSIAWPILLFGNIAAGFKCTLANSGYTPSELSHQWKDSRAEVAYVHPELLPVVLEMFVLMRVSPAQARKRIILASFAYQKPLPSGFVTMDQLMAGESLEQEERFDGPLADETALLCYSSGKAFVCTFTMTLTYSGAHRHDWKAKRCGGTIILFDSHACR
jgi:4-coumarate--CoA ligase